MQDGQYQTALSTSTDVEAARSVFQSLLDVLGSLPEPDHQRGREAAEIIERHLRTGVPLPGFWSILTYDLGGKGLQDWAWSAPALAAIQPPLDAAWKGIAALQQAEIQARTGA